MTYFNLKSDKGGTKKTLSNKKSRICVFLELECETNLNLLLKLLTIDTNLVTIGLFF